MKEHLIDRQLWRKHMTKKMRTIVQKLIAASLSVSLVIGLTGCSGSSASQNANQTAGAESGQSTDMNATGSAANAAAAQEVVFHPPVDTLTVIPEEKEETVYVQADAAGRPTKKTVEVALKKIRGEDPVEDRSNLREIRNTEGNEEYSEAGEGRYLWENHGEEIRYKGESDQPLPVDVTVTYYLEGSEVTADEIAGKTGAVRIRFDYDNHTDVPFMVLSSAILSGDVFSDIEVTNGRILDLGDRKAVIGFAFPGLMDSLKLADYEPTEEIDLPEYVEIEAHAVDFALDFTATVVSTGLFDELEDEDLKDFEDMADDMDELTDASSELADAAGELADGGATFGEYLDQYFGGLSKVSEGTGALDDSQKAQANWKRASAGSSSLWTRSICRLSPQRRAKKPRRRHRKPCRHWQRRAETCLRNSAGSAQQWKGCRTFLQICRTMQTRRRRLRLPSMRIRHPTLPVRQRSWRRLLKKRLRHRRGRQRRKLRRTRRRTQSRKRQRERQTQQRRTRKTRQSRACGAVMPWRGWGSQTSRLTRSNHS